MARSDVKKLPTEVLWSALRTYVDAVNSGWRPEIYSDHLFETKAAVEAALLRAEGIEEYEGRRRNVRRAR